MAERKPIKRNLKRINVQRRNSRGVRNRFRKRTEQGLNNREKEFVDRYLEGDFDKKLDLYCCDKGDSVCPPGFLCARNCQCMIDNGE